MHLSLYHEFSYPLIITRLQHEIFTCTLFKIARFNVHRIVCQTHVGMRVAADGVVSVTRYIAASLICARIYRYDGRSNAMMHRISKNFHPDSESTRIFLVNILFHYNKKKSTRWIVLTSERERER